MIPAGLIDENAEVFENNGDIYTIYNSRLYSSVDMPQTIKDIIDENITDQDNIELDKMGITGAEERRIQWMHCNLAPCDNFPDIIIKNRHVTREFKICDKRFNCSSSGKLCLTLEQKTGLTATELLILTYHGQTLLDKEIADKTGISENTVKVHNKHIRKKLGLSRKPDLAIYAQQLLAG